jgi:hypothetical protein
MEVLVLSLMVAPLGVAGFSFLLVVGVLLADPALLAPWFCADLPLLLLLTLLVLGLSMLFPFSCEAAAWDACLGCIDCRRWTT